MSKNLKRSFILLFMLLIIGTGNAAGPDESVIPVYAEFLLGGRLNGEWVEAEKIADKLIASQTWKAFAFDRQLPDQQGGMPRREEGPGEYWDITFPDAGEGGEVILRVASDKAAMPRKPRLQSGGLETYEKIVAGYLKKNGITSAPKLRQVIRVDLDGDGSEEVFIVADNVDATVPVTVANTYSLVLFRCLKNGKVETTALRENYNHEGIEGMADSPNAYKVSFVVDLDGNGTMEVIIYGRYYEGFWYEIHEFSGGVLKKVFSEGLGA